MNRIITTILLLTLSIGSNAQYPELLNASANEKGKKVIYYKFPSERSIESYSKLILISNTQDSFSIECEELLIKRVNNNFWVRPISFDCSNQLCLIRVYRHNGIKEWVKTDTFEVQRNSKGISIDLGSLCEPGITIEEIESQKEIKLFYLDPHIDSVDIKSFKLAIVTKDSVFTSDHNSTELNFEALFSGIDRQEIKSIIIDEIEVEIFYDEFYNNQAHSRNLAPKIYTVLK